MEMVYVSPLQPVKRVPKTPNERLLPDDVILDIVERLPVRSLMRFKCVSKGWCTLIKSQCFIKKHFLKQQQEEDTGVLLLWKYLHNTGVFSFHNPDSPELAEVCSNVLVPFKKNYLDSSPRSRPCIVENTRLLGSCNGIVCIVYGYNVALCNPALREYKKLPPSPPVISDDDEDHSKLVMGRGFGITSTGDFKFVLILGIFDLLTLAFDMKAQVYNLSTDAWTEVDMDPDIVPDVRRRGPQVFLNG